MNRGPNVRACKVGRRGNAQQKCEDAYNFHEWISRCDLRIVSTRASAPVWLTRPVVFVSMCFRTWTYRLSALSPSTLPPPLSWYILAHHSWSITYRHPTNPCALSELERRQHTGERQTEENTHTHSLSNTRTQPRPSITRRPLPGVRSSRLQPFGLTEAGCAMGQACGHALLCRSQPPSSEM